MSGDCGAPCINCQHGFGEKKAGIQSHSKTVAAVVSILTSAKETVASTHKRLGFDWFDAFVAPWLRYRKGGGSLLPWRRPLPCYGCAGAAADAGRRSSDTTPTHRDSMLSLHDPLYAPDLVLLVVNYNVLI